MPLYLQNEEDGPYPVMLWFYGGAFQAGSNINYPGHFLASHGVVVVVPNYRVGNLGILSDSKKKC